MMWDVQLHPLVVREDLPALDVAVQQRILKVIQKKLGTAPDRYGVPLRGAFHGFWKLRIGEYRVVYTMQQQKVLVQVVKIGARRNDKVYRTFTRRQTEL